MRRTALPAAALAAAGLVAGCSGSGSSSSGTASSGTASSPTRSASSAVAAGAQAVQASYGKTLQAKSAKVAVTTTLNTQGRSLTFSGNGAVDFATKHSTLYLDLPQIGRTEVRMLGGMLYEKLPATLSGKLPGHKPWISINLDRITQEKFGQSFSSLSSSSNNDPTQVLSYLRGASNDVKTVGTEQIRGAPTTHYAATVDLDKVAAQEPKQAPTVRRLESEYGVTSLPVQVWIGKDGLARRIAVTEKITKGKAAGTTTSIREDLYDFRTPVSVTAPPKSQVTDLSALLSQQTSTASS